MQRRSLRWKFDAAHCKHQLTFVSIVRRIVRTFTSETCTKYQWGFIRHWYESEWTNFLLSAAEIFRSSFAHSHYFPRAALDLAHALVPSLVDLFSRSISRRCQKTYHFVKLMRWSTHWPIINEWVRRRIRFRAFQSIIGILQVIRSTCTLNITILLIIPNAKHIATVRYLIHWRNFNLLIGLHFTTWFCCVAIQ